MVIVEREMNVGKIWSKLQRMSKGQNTCEDKTLLCFNLLDFPVRKKRIISYLLYHRAMITEICPQRCNE